MFVGVVEREAERGANEPELADRSLVDELAHAARLRVVPVHERLHEEPPRARRPRRTRLDLGRAAIERLLAEHVLPGLERADRPLDVQRVRAARCRPPRRRVREQRLVAAVRALDLPLARVLLGAGLVAARRRR